MLSIVRVWLGTRAELELEILALRHLSLLFKANLGRANLHRAILREAELSHTKLKRKLMGEVAATELSRGHHGPPKLKLMAARTTSMVKSTSSGDGSPMA